MTSEDRLAVSVRCGHALVELGVDASTADLVAASGLSERSFFRQFPTKADCIRPLLEHGHRRFVAEFTRRAEAGPRDLAETARSALVAAYDDGPAELDREFLALMLGERSYRRVWLEVNDDTAIALVVPVAQALGVSEQALEARFLADQITVLVVTALRLMVSEGLSVEQASAALAEVERRHQP